MTLETVGTALIRRHIGRRLTDLRVGAELTQEQVAKAVTISRSTVVRMEEGNESVRLPEPYLKALLDLYEAGEDDRRVVLALAAETRNGRKKGWWHDYTELSEWFGLYILLEDSATNIREYESELVPGLLQTREYAEAVIGTPPGVVDKHQIEQRVNVRVERQKMLTRTNPPRFDVVLNEAVLRRPIGEPGLMSRQLQRLLEDGKRPNISVRVLPFAAGVHGGMTACNSFMLLDFPGDPTGSPIEPSLAYVDTLTGAMYLNKPEEFDTYQLVWRDIHKKALSARESTALIASALEGLER